MDPSSFEHLGAFYLGHRVVDGERTDDPVLYDAKDLTTHCVCVGMTGSGKTGLSVVLLEEAAIDGVPVIAIDPKGDLGNLLLTFPGLSAAEFAPWVDSTEDPARVAATWKEGLARSGQDGGRVARFEGAVERAIYTPGSSSGRPLAVLGRLSPPPRAIREDADALRDEVEASVSALCALIDVDPDPVGSSEHILLSTLLTRAWLDERELDLAELVRQVLDPPLDRVGALALDDFLPPADRRKLGMRLNHLLAAPGFAPWLEGEPLDVGRLLYTQDGRPRLSILSIAHLSDRERMFFVTLLLSRVVTWMRGQPGTSSLRAVLFMDEVFGFFPPVQEPPSKRPMLTLLKQARAHGLGVMLATQNPIDLDYRGLSNCGTWLLGRLSTERDVDRILEGLAGASQSDFDPAEVRRALAGLGKRRFLMRNVHERAPVTFETRWAMSYLRGPLTRAQIAQLTSRPASAAAPAASPPLAETRAARPALDVPERFLAPLAGRGEIEWRAGLVASVQLHYAHAASGLDAWLAPTVLAHGGTWTDAELLDPRAMPWVTEPADGRWSDVPRAVTAKGGLAKLEKALKSHLGKTQIGYVFRAPDHKAWSTPGETRAEFTSRIALLGREERDREVQKLREKYAPKVQRLEARLDRARDAVHREQSQYSARKMDTAVSVGSTMLGALFGRSVLGRATTAARSASRVSKEREDIARAQEDVRELEAELRELEAEARDALKALEDAPLATPHVEEREVRPRKGDLEITDLAVAWIPWRTGPDGIAREAWRAPQGSA
ncbi:MAG: ATP-binding protein [Sandaracinaceae bacterium]|nr:ATP-binding protein [Sandaracinaceae bacterium]